MTFSRKVRKSQTTNYMDRMLLLVNPDPGQLEEIVTGLVEHGIANAADRVCTLPMPSNLKKLGRSVLLRVWFTDNNWPEFGKSFQQFTRASKPTTQIVMDLNDNEIHLISVQQNKSQVVSLVLDPSDSPVLEDELPEGVTVSGSMTELINIATNLMSRKVYVP